MRSFEERLEEYVHTLTAYPDRHVGGPGNHAATRFFSETAMGLGFTVTRTSFDCIEWEYGDAVLKAGGREFVAHVGPYSNPCDVRGRLVAVSTIEELEAQDVQGAVVLLHGPIAAGQIMPKNFTFYNPESHKRIVRALEAGRPAAIVAATGRDPEMVGSQYPFPLFEDGDLEIPNTYMTDIAGQELLDHVGKDVSLRVDSRRIPTTGEHVVATLPGSERERIVVSAHIDSRKDSPGGLDNASGVAVLLGAMELLQDYDGGPSIEVVPFNGEDNYANPGEMLWVAENEGRFEEIILGINIDDAAQRGCINHVSFYECPPHIEAAARDAMAGFDALAEGPKWYQSDHAIFGIHGRPALAIASSDIAGFMADYAHTERDTASLVDPGLVEDAARFIRELVERIAGPGS